ncbi:MAG: hypothetical protein JXB15_17155 [Anaerolineales bacterium]|nr:hypothetical protein [Anaerolineales bacterium]
MEPVEVIARYESGQAGSAGKITPLRFTWQGGVYPVTSTGRRWQDESGYHILVMAPGPVPGGEQVYELLFALERACWYLKSPGQARRAAA